MKKFLFAAVVASLLLGCNLLGPASEKDTGMTADQAGTILSSTFNPAMNSIDMEAILSGGTPTLPAGVAYTATETGGTVTFTNYTTGGCTYNGSVVIAIDMSNVIVNETTYEMTGTMSMSMSGSMTSSGASAHTCSYSFTMATDMATQAMTYSGTMTVDGTTFDYSELASYMTDTSA
ncbi:MAG: hypothetical protein A2Z99_07905 [Treponema sp. GWB1_62_6]|nr:MAG: hypothetical protein A2Z99_07905 [Treponema sp. GWB1_62_6]HCM29131.1 hypothetical protein [Treponema sp.]